MKNNMYPQIIAALREAYNHNAAERDQYPLADWKADERQHFLTLLQQQNCKRLLELGSGPGRDGKFFQDNGLDVICTDLSPEMVERCRAKGLTAYVMDFLSLDFPDASFDAVYALNCLLHVPKKDLRTVLQTAQRLLKPSGLFYLGVWGGHDFEGELPQDTYIPKRFFSFYTDEQIQSIVSEFFEVLYFKAVPVEGETERHFQSMILKRR